MIFSGLLRIDDLEVTSDSRNGGTRQPRPRDFYSHGAQVDPAYEAEIREFISTPSKQELALLAHEGAAEFGPAGPPCPDCPASRAAELRLGPSLYCGPDEYADDMRELEFIRRMEADVDPQERLLHPPSKPEW